MGASSAGRPEDPPVKLLSIDAPGGLDRLRLEDVPDPGAPGPGEIRVRVQTSSLNDHDSLVVSGGTRTAHGRMIPLADGAGVVEPAGGGRRGVRGGRLRAVRWAGPSR